MKKCLFLAIMTLAVVTIVFATPIDQQLTSTFAALDKSAPDYPAKRALLCKALTNNVRHHTMQAAELQEMIDIDTENHVAISQDEKIRLKKLTGRVAFENSEYASYCSE